MGYISCWVCMLWNEMVRCIMGTWVIPPNQIRPLVRSTLSYKDLQGVFPELNLYSGHYKINFFNYNFYPLMFLI